jgi:hypothetical protein
LLEHNSSYKNPFINLTFKKLKLVLWMILYIKGFHEKPIIHSILKECLHKSRKSQSVITTLKEMRLLIRHTASSPNKYPHLCKHKLLSLKSSPSGYMVGAAYILFQHFLQISGNKYFIFDKFWKFTEKSMNSDLFDSKTTNA